LLNPDLITNVSINPDARARAKKVLNEIISAGSYTHSLGIPLVRESVCKYIAKMDSVPEPRLDDIFLTEGASQGVHLLLSTLIIDKNDAIMIPIPQYPLYTASIALNGGVPAPYFLNESKGWQLDIEELERSYQESVKQGKRVKAIVVINPGNPTGSILSSDTIAKIIEFSVRNRVVVIADEVYRENVYKEGTAFVSFRKILETLGQEVRDNC
jgi:aspartate/methionine/tyrosine aminotransferase